MTRFSLVFAFLLAATTSFTATWAQPPAQQQATPAAESHPSSTQSSTTQSVHQSTVIENPLASYTHFSASMSGGLVKDEGTKIFRSGNLMRINLEKEYRLTDLENSTTWVVRPAKCTHVPGPDGRSYPFSAYRNFKMERVAP